MPNGFVYVLMNPALKGQVKIGMTTNSPDQRAAELSTTGVPHQFVVVYAERVRDCEQVERLLHEKLAKVRVNPNREFFRITAQAAVRAVIEVAEPFRIDEPADGEEAPYTTQNRNHFPDANNVLDQQQQAKLQEEKRIHRTLLKRELAKAKSQGS
jgi:hypothetical protein